MRIYTEQCCADQPCAHYNQDTGLMAGDLPVGADPDSFICDGCGTFALDVRPVGIDIVACRSCFSDSAHTADIIADRAGRYSWQSLPSVRLAEIGVARCSLTEESVARSLFLAAHWAGRTYLHVAVPVKAARPVWAPVNQGVWE